MGGMIKTGEELERAWWNNGFFLKWRNLTDCECLPKTEHMRMDSAYLTCIHSLRSYEMMNKLKNTFQYMKKKGKTELNTIP